MFKKRKIEEEEIESEEEEIEIEEEEIENEEEIESEEIEIENEEEEIESENESENEEEIESENESENEENESESEYSDFDYIGEFDKNGRPHGKGAMTSSKTKFTGNFVHGMRQGQGVIEFESDESGRRDKLSGNWKQDRMHGFGVYTFVNGDRIEGQYKHGTLSGSVKEYSKNKLAWEGIYSNGMRKKGIQYFPFGCRLEGPFFNHQPHGNCTFFYPDGSKIEGKWKNGELQHGVFVNTKGKVFDTPVYRYDPPTRRHISADPLMQDPYEKSMVYVKSSNIGGAGEGLYAKRTVSKDTLLSFYSGILISSSKSNGRPWLENSNTIELRRGTVIDVPDEFASTSVYRATLGHKANHSFRANARYETVFHPRFGEIKAVVSRQKIKKGQEIFCDYEYSAKSGPVWFREKRKLYLKRKKSKKPTK